MPNNYLSISGLVTTIAILSIGITVFVERYFLNSAHYISGETHSVVENRVFRAPIPRNCNISANFISEGAPLGLIASVKIIDFNMRLTSEIYGTRYLEVEYARGNQSELFDHIHRKYEGCLLNTFKTYKSLEEMFGDISAFYSTPAFQKPMYAIIDESGAKLFFKLLLPASPAN